MFNTFSEISICSCIPFCTLRYLSRRLGTLALIIAPLALADTEQATTDGVPEIYKTLQLESLEATPSFRFRSFRKVDRQSLAIISRKREIFLLIFEEKIKPNPKAISFGDSPINSMSGFSERIRAGQDKVCVFDDFGLPDCHRVVVIYMLADREEENEIREYLRGAIQD